MNPPLVAQLQSLSFRRAPGGLPIVTAHGIAGPFDVGLGASAGAIGDDAWPATLFDQLAARASGPGAGAATQTFMAEVTAARDALRESAAVWLRLTDDTPAQQLAWIAVFSSDGVQLIGVQSLDRLPIELPGFAANGSAWLGASLRLSKSGESLAVGQARILLLGEVSATAGSGTGVFSLDGANGSLELSVRAAHLPPISALLDDPKDALQGAWDADLKASLGFAAGGTFFGLQVQAGREVTLDAQVRSSAGDAALTLKRLSIVDAMTLGAGLPQVVGSLALTLRAELFDVELAGGPSPDLRLSASGEAQLTLNVPAGEVLPTGFAGAIDAQIEFEHDAAGEDRLALLVQTAAPEPGPALKRFGLPPADLRLTLVRPRAAGGQARAWQLALRARFVQPWQQVAQALDSAVRLLPGVEAAAATPLSLPDLRCALHAELGGANPLLELDVELVQLALPADWPDGGALVDRYRRYDGPLGPLPLDVADASFHLALPLQGGDGPSASGLARITSAWNRIGAGDVLPPLSAVQCYFALQPGGQDGTPPSLKLGADGGFPPLRMPVPGRAPITLIHPQRFELAFGQAFELTAEVVLADQSLFTALREGFDMPDGWEPLVDVLQSAVSGVHGTLRLCLPLTESAEGAACQAPTLRVELRAGEENWVDLFELLAGISGQSLTPQSDDAPIEAARDGSLAERSTLHQLDHESGDGPFAVRPNTLVFEVALPDTGAKLHLHATVLARVLGETFDAGLFFDLESGLPTLRLGAGFEDPIRISIPGAAPGFIDEPVLAQQIRSDLFGGSAAHDAQVQQLLQQWNAVFSTLTGSPDEPLMVFEIRNLQVRFALGSNGLDVGASGGVQIVQLPPLLNDVLPLPGPTAVLGATATSIYIELQPPLVTDTAQTVPLISIPLASDGTMGVNGATLSGPQNLDLYFGGFAVGYSWAPSAIQLRLKAGLGLPQALLALADFLPLAYRLPPGQPGIPSAWMDVELRQLTAKAPPIVLWSLKFGDTDASHSENRGFEYVLQVPRVPGPPLVRQQDLFVQYLRQFSLIPMTQLMHSAIVLDWGLQVGSDHVFDSHGNEQPAEPVLRMQFRGTTLQFLPSPLVVFFPWAYNVPPALPLPPWAPAGLLGVWPSFSIPMVDLFTGPPLPGPGGRTDHAIQLLARVPGVARIEAGLSRPMPSLPIPALIEMALLGQRLLAGELDGLDVPAGSAIRDIAYLEAALRIDLPVLEVFGDAVVAASPFPIEANTRIDLGDALNIVFPVVGKASRALVAAQETAAQASGTVLQRVEQATGGGRDLFVELDRRQSALLKLAPLSLRRMHQSVSVGLTLPGFGSLQFGCTIAVCLLTPDELTYELRLYHERLRPPRRRLEDALQGGANDSSVTAPPLSAPVQRWPAVATFTLQVVRQDSYPAVAHAQRAARPLRSTRLAASVREVAIDRVLAQLRGTRPPALRERWLRAHHVDWHSDRTIEEWVKRDAAFPAVALTRAILGEVEKRRPVRARLRHGFARRVDKLAAELAKIALRYEADAKLEPWCSRVPIGDAKALVERQLRGRRLAAEITARLESVVRNAANDNAICAPHEVEVMRNELQRKLALTFGRRAAERENAALVRKIAAAAVRVKAVPRGHILRSDPKMLEAGVASILKAVGNHGGWIAQFSELARKAAVGPATRIEFARTLKQLNVDYTRLLEAAALVGQGEAYNAGVGLVFLRLVSQAAGLARWERTTSSSNAGYSTERVDLRYVGPAWAKALAGDDRPPVDDAIRERQRRVSKGFALSARGAGGKLLDESVFLLPVNGANPMFDVVARAGAYKVRLWAVDRIDAERFSPARPTLTTLISETTLPPEVTALESATPGKAARLRARLELRERFVMEPAEAPPAQQLMFGADFHRESVFWTAADPALAPRSPVPSPLFELATPTAVHPLPGSHGRLNIADLLVHWDNAGAPSYIVPNRPVLLAGLNLTLMAAGSGAGRLKNDFVVNLRGLVLPADSHSNQVAGLPGIAVPPAPQPPSLFFSARVAHTLRFGNGIDVELDGEIRYLDGPAWHDVGLPAQSDGLGFAAGLRFRGVARLSVGGKVAAEGAATGSFVGGSLSLQLDTALNIPSTSVSSGELASSMTNTLVTSSSFPNLVGLRYAAHGQARFDLTLTPSSVVVVVAAENLNGFVQVEWELLQQIPEVVGEVCDWTLQLFNKAADFAASVVEAAVDLVEKGLGTTNDDQVDVTVFGVVIGRFERVCDDVVEQAESMLPQSTRVPPLGGDASVSLSGDLNSQQAVASFEFAIETPDGKQWRWGLALNGPLPEWFALPP